MSLKTAKKCLSYFPWVSNIVIWYGIRSNAIKRNSRTNCQIFDISAFWWKGKKSFSWVAASNPANRQSVIPCEKTSKRSFPPLPNSLLKSYSQKILTIILRTNLMLRYLNVNKPTYNILISTNIRHIWPKNDITFFGEYPPRETADFLIPVSI